MSLVGLIGVQTGVCAQRQVWTATSAAMFTRGMSSFQMSVASNKAKPPPRPLPAFFRYLKEARGGVRDGNPWLGPREIVSEVASMWWKLDKSVRDKYKQQYHQDMSAWKAKYTVQV